MTKVPSLHYDQLIRAPQRAGFAVIRRKGSHIRLEKTFEDGAVRLTVPAHKPIKRSTLAHILKEARISPDDLLALL